MLELLKIVFKRKLYLCVTKSYAICFLKIILMNQYSVMSQLNTENSLL